ncbi:MAG: zeta toxin family protein [Clostridia bacterium]|nr:zeta toxin family protein [Clostridia bacterium]
MVENEFDLEYLETVTYKIFKEMTLDISGKTDEIPKAVILGGQSGAGKTILQEIFAQGIQNIIIINGDEFRKYHPHYKELSAKYGKDSVKYTSEFSSQVTNRLIKLISDERYNILIEGTLRTSQVPLDTCKNLKKKGYYTILGIMAVKPEISFLSTIARYEMMLFSGDIPRATPKEHHDAIVKMLPCNLEENWLSRQFDNIFIFNRQKRILYNMNDSVFSSTPRDIISRVLNGEWTEQEIEEFISIGNSIVELKTARVADDLQEFQEKYFNKSIINDLKSRKEGNSIDTFENLLT